MATFARRVVTMAARSELDPDRRHVPSIRRAVVLGNDRRLVEQVVGTLGREGTSAFALAPDRTTAEELAEADLVVDLNVAPDGGGGEATERALRSTYQVLRGVLPSWSSVEGADMVAYVAATCLGGRLGLGPPSGHLCDSGVWAGITKAIVHEAPACRIRVVDFSEAMLADVGSILLEELRHGDLVEVGRTTGARWTAFPTCMWSWVDALEWGPSDLVLFTGGARGIGWLAARELAERHGCHVMVTGRFQEDEALTLATLSGEAFAALRGTELTTPQRGTLRCRRLRVERWRAEREAGINLLHARSRGLDVRYRRCDVTSEAEITALVVELAAQLSGVVHNAGINRPTRFAKKPLEDVLDVVRVKVGGFRNLLTAIDLTSPARLKSVMVVGSVSGRSGGMPGELDYAGANDGVARLALQARLSVPVQVVAWPTWATSGMANHQATAEYMDALPERAGVDRWLQELTSVGGGEVVVMGRVHGNLNPVLASGLAMSPALPSASSLSAHQSLLGRVTSFQPRRRLFHSVRLGRQGWIPALGPLPIDVLLELAVRSAWWLEPSTGISSWVHCRDVVLSSQLLCDDLIEVRSVRPAQGEVVEVHLGGEQRVTVVAGDAPRPQIASAATLGAAGAAAEANRWRRGSVIEVPAAPEPADLWSSLVPPTFMVPYPVVGAVAAAMGERREPWTADLVAFRPGAWPGGPVALGADGSSAQAWRKGELVAVLDGLAARQIKASVGS